MTKYDPTSLNDRRRFAHEIMGYLDRLGFRRQPRKHHREEMVFDRRVQGYNSLLVRVYTTVVDHMGVPECRTAGKDALRVALIFERPNNAGTRGLRAEIRVHRSGTVESILARILARIESVEAVIKELAPCRDCGCPTFLSKQGNEVCADVCFSRPRVRKAPAPALPRASEENEARPVDPPESVVERYLSMVANDGFAF